MANLKKISPILILLVLAAHAPAYSDNPMIKFSRGLTNVVTAPGEFLIQYKALREGSDPFTTIFATLISGTVHTGARVLVGFYDILTFPAPVPPHYAPLYEPATFFEAMKEIDGKA